MRGSARNSAPVSLLSSSDRHGRGSSMWPRGREVLAAFLALMFVVSVWSHRASIDAQDRDPIQAMATRGLKLGEDSGKVTNEVSPVLAGEYPDQDDSRGRQDNNKAADILLGEEEEEELEDHRNELLAESLEVMQSARVGEVEEEVREERAGAVRVKSLGDLLFDDGEAYMAAPDIDIPDVPIPSYFYEKVWYLQKLHDEFFQRYTHKLHIPHLAQSITRKQFHEVFRQTSTPVVMKFDHLRNLGVLTKAWTIKELRERFPYEPTPGAKKVNYGAQAGFSNKQLDLGPALYELEKDAKLEKNGGTLRNFPRNLMIKPKYLALLDATFPPFVPKSRFQIPTLWMGTSTADTKLHHDCCDNFVMMIAGTKRWTIAPPPDTRQLRPVVCTGKHQSLCWAALQYPNDPNMSAADRVRLNSLQRITIDLKAGEMMYLPAGWWHHIENLGPTVMVNFWTRGCSNSEVALDADPLRSDRPDLFQCPAVAQKTADYINMS